MKCSLESIKSKEVIDIKTGERLGYVDDVEIDLRTSQVIALKIYGRERFFGLFGREADIRIPCGDIRVVGSDVMLVRAENFEISSKSLKYKKKYCENSSLDKM